MTRAALRKPQHDLFAPGPAAAMAVQPARPKETAAHLHPCEAPGCDAWGAFGVGVFAGVPGRWLCFTHRHLESESTAA